MNIYQKISQLRVEVAKANIKKSGENNFSKFFYYELGDFLPLIIQLEEKLGLLSMFSVDSLTVVNIEKPEETIVFTTKTAEANMKGALEIQKVGAENTYAKRYVYLNYLNLTEPDQVDRLDQKESIDKTKKEKVFEKVKKQNEYAGGLPAKIMAIKEGLGNDEEKFNAYLVFFKTSVETMTDEVADKMLARIAEKKK